MSTETEMVKVLDELRADLKHVRNDVDVMKGILLEDRFLSSDERKHLDETMRLLKEGKKSDFVKIA
ncbi:MAG: hypothetical protein AABX47_08095 [Nanoarchaeota archaeon]